MVTGADEQFNELMYLVCQRAIGVVHEQNFDDVVIALLRRVHQGREAILAKKDRGTGLKKAEVNMRNETQLSYL